MTPVTNRRLLALAAMIVLATIGVGIYGLLRGAGHSKHALHNTRRGSLDAGNPARTARGTRPAVLPRTDDPLAYARAVAAAIFDWSTTSGYSPADYAAPVLADADPTGEELSGLVEDLTGYEPTSEQWAQLASMQVTQRLWIESAAVPSLWRQALTQAHGQLRPGTTAVTITGVLRRHGVFYGQRAASSSPVSFTIFEACSPAFRRCHTLRLSQLNNPLR